MPPLVAPIFQLDAAKIHEVNPRDVEALFGLWTGERLDLSVSGSVALILTY